MSNGSFYVRDNPAFKGGSPQAVYEELWERGRKQRKIVSAVVAFAFFAIGLRIATPFTALGMAAAGFLGATAGQWYRRAMHTVWLHGRRGDQRTAKVLRYLLEPRGYRVLYGRSVPEHGTVDQLVIGPTGVWVVNSYSWPPEAQFEMYNGRLFIGKDIGAPQITELAAMAETVSDLINERLRQLPADGAIARPQVLVSPLLVVYGGTMPLRRLVSEGVMLARSFQVPGRIRRGGSRTRLTPEQIEEVTQAAIRALPIGGRTMATR